MSKCQVFVRSMSLKSVLIAHDTANIIALGESYQIILILASANQTIWVFLSRCRSMSPSQHFDYYQMLIVSVQVHESEEQSLDPLLLFLA